MYGEEMRTFLEILLAFFIGAILGAVFMWYHCGRDIGDQIVDSSYSRTVDDVTTLAMLQKHLDMELKEQKERDLSDALFGLSSVETLRKIPEKKLSYLKMAAGYRERFPFLTGDTNIDDQVGRFLNDVRAIK